jgi:hypothetical protein
VVIAVDESASMAPAALRDAQAWIDQSLRTRRTADRVGLVAFAGDVKVVEPPTAGDTLARLPDPASLKPGATDLAGALRVASGLVRGASNPRVVLLSDGANNAGDLTTALKQTGDVPVDVIPIARPPDTPEVQVESVQIPQYVRVGETFDGTVTIDATEQGPAHLQVAVDGQIANEQDLQLAAGQSHVTVSSTVMNEGSIRSRCGSTAIATPTRATTSRFRMWWSSPNLACWSSRSGRMKAWPSRICCVGPT